MELNDKYYPTKGKVSAFMMVPCIIIIVVVFSVGRLGFVYERDLYFFCLMFLVCCVGLFYFSRFVLKEWFGKTHYPVRFNRKKKLVHVYQVNGGVVTLPWGEIYFTVNKQRINCCIVGHVLAEDKNTILNTFSFGYVGQRSELVLYWEFIRCYMEEDCLDELAEMVLFCPPVEKQREGYITGLQQLMKINSRVDWIMLVFNFPFAVVESIARYIAMQTSKIPQWPQDVLDACVVDPADPINVGAENNPPHRWRTVLANESREVFDATDKRLKLANERIKSKLIARYGDS